MEQVLGTDCPSTRDTSIQIFDKFLMLSYSEEPRVLDNKDYLSYAAAASVILGAKLNDTKSLLTMVSVGIWLCIWLLSKLTIIHLHINRYSPSSLTLTWIDWSSLSNTFCSRQVVRCRHCARLPTFCTTWWICPRIFQTNRSFCTTQIFSLQSSLQVCCLVIVNCEKEHWVWCCPIFI